MVVLPHTMLHAKRYLDRLSCFCRAYGRDLTHRQTDHATPPVSHLCLAGLPEVAMPYSDKIARFHSCTPGHATPSRAIGWSTPPDPSWKRHRVDHVPNGPTNSAAITTMFDVPIATLWRQAIGRGHSRATLRSEPTTR